MEVTRLEMDKGLSPRVRGNLTADNMAGNQPGSIPACTGEPSYEAER